MTVVFALIFPFLSIAASIATLFALVKFVRDLRRDLKA
jgi:hypothetical protein